MARAVSYDFCFCGLRGPNGQKFKMLGKKLQISTTSPCTNFPILIKSLGLLIASSFQEMHIHSGNDSSLLAVWLDSCPVLIPSVLLLTRTSLGSAWSNPGRLAGMALWTQRRV